MLMEAAWNVWNNGITGAVEALLRAGADVNHQSNNGKYYILNLCVSTIKYKYLEILV